MQALINAQYGAQCMQIPLYGRPGLLDCLPLMGLAVLRPHDANAGCSCPQEQVRTATRLTLTLFS